VTTVTSLAYSPLSLSLSFEALSLYISWVSAVHTRFFFFFFDEKSLFSSLLNKKQQQLQQDCYNMIVGIFSPLF
jgi:hypothetical protein